MLAQYQANKEDNTNNYYPKEVNIENLISQSEQIEYANSDNTESGVVVEWLAHTSKNNTENSPHDSPLELSVIIQQKETYADAVISYLVMEKRKKYKKFFLSGIADGAKERQIYSYLNKRGITPSFICIFPSKRKGNISARVYIPLASNNMVLEDDFQPEFVRSKPWLPKKENKFKPLKGKYSTYV